MQQTKNVSDASATQKQKYRPLLYNLGRDRALSSAFGLVALFTMLAMSMCVAMHSHVGHSTNLFGVRTFTPVAMCSTPNAALEAAMREIEQAAHNLEAYDLDEFVASINDDSFSLPAWHLAEQTSAQMQAAEQAAEETAELQAAVKAAVLKAVKQTASKAIPKAEVSATAAPPAASSKRDDFLSGLQRSGFRGVQEFAVEEEPPPPPFAQDENALLRERLLEEQVASLREELEALEQRRELELQRTSAFWLDRLRIKEASLQALMHAGSDVGSEAGSSEAGSKSDGKSEAAPGFLTWWDEFTKGMGK